MSKSLVIPRVGANSLHPLWITRGTPRDWDLYLCPFQEIPPQDGLDVMVGDVIPGWKWSGLREVLNRWDGWREYDYIWLPDDDIYTDQATISRMFEIARTLGLDLFAPALHETSHFAHFDTMVNRRFAARASGFVEIMVPAFSRPVLEQLLHTLDLTDTGWGWGLDSVWPKILNYENVGMIDATPVLHTRPVGAVRDPELAKAVIAESDRLLATYECEQVHATFGAYGHDLERLDLAPEVLLSELVAGYGYLIERDPRVLAWIAEFQRQHFPSPAYPVAGTP
jgi:hypothetical protein